MSEADMSEAISPESPKPAPVPSQPLMCKRISNTANWVLAFGIAPTYYAFFIWPFIEVRDDFQAPVIFAALLVSGSAAVIISLALRRRPWAPRAATILVGIGLPALLLCAAYVMSAVAVVVAVMVFGDYNSPEVLVATALLFALVLAFAGWLAWKSVRFIRYLLSDEVKRFCGGEPDRSRDEGEGESS
jgi:hypothetical protein